MRNPIPRAALDDRLGFIGTSGSGKTYCAGVAVETLLALQKARVVIVDPLGVWWGLRLLADGKTQSRFDVAIFGGAHGDLPLTEHAGALIGETAATMAGSCIIDLSELRGKSSERRFMTAFLDTIYLKATKEPFHLVVDEADLFAPQSPQKGAETLLGHMEDIVRRGRVKGFIPWLISQRPAVINKNVLSQVDGLIAFKLTATQDRDALDDWIEGQADKAQGKEIKASLPTLHTGQGVVWLPGHGILTTAQFPQKVTFDSSRTPKRGEKLKSRKLKALNVDALKGKLATVEAEAKANNPTALRSEIAKLKAEKARLEKNATAAKPVDKDALKAAEQRGFDQAKKKFAPACQRVLNKAVAGAFKMAAQRAGELAGVLQGDFKMLTAELPALETEITFEASAPPTATPVPRAVPTVVPQAAPRAKPISSAGADSGADGAFSRKAERLVMTAIAQYPQGRTKKQAAILAGYAVNGGGFNNALGALRGKGFVVGSDNLQATQEGLEALGSFDPLPSGPALLDHWMNQLGRAAERAVLQAVVEAYPNSISTTDAALKAGYEPKGGGFGNALGKLRTLELISGRGELRASDELFEAA